jgi:2'-5' RNA ligase
VSSPATVGGDEQLRLFLALRLPERTIAALVRWGERHLTAGRRLPADHLHVTLAFLGWRPASDLPAIVEALRAATEAATPFELAARGYRETRSVGMVVLDDPSGEAARLAGGIHARLARLGVYRPEARAWLPHVTVLRFRERPRLQPPPPRLAPFAPSDAAVYLSRLHPSGARYEVLQTAPLAPAGGGAEDGTGKG